MKTRMNEKMDGKNAKGSKRLEDKKRFAEQRQTEYGVR